MSSVTPFVPVYMVQSVAAMALRRFAKCCRTLLHDPCKGVFFGVLQPGWMESFAGGKTNGTRKHVPLEKRSCLSSSHNTHVKRSKLL